MIIDYLKPPLKRSFPIHISMYTGKFCTATFFEDASGLFVVLLSSCSFLRSRMRLSCLRSYGCVLRLEDARKVALQSVSNPTSLLTSTTCIHIPIRYKSIFLNSFSVFTHCILVEAFNEVLVVQYLSPFPPSCPGFLYGFD